MLSCKSNGEVSNKSAGCAAGASTATTMPEDSTDTDTDRTRQEGGNKQTHLADGVLQRVVRHLQRDVLRLQPVVELLCHQAGHTQQLVRGQGIKHDDVVEAVEELRPEELLDL